jgi:hypothetical protein
MQEETRTQGNPPDALVIGPMRSATTWIHHYLQTREDVCLPKDVKETFFFDRRFEKGKDWYICHFQNCQSANRKTTIEVGPSYFHSSKAPERIKDTLGRIPLVVIYRNPVERSYSHFAHLRRYGFTNHPLRKATEEFPEILAASRYAKQLDRWTKHVGACNISILQIQTLKDSPTQFAINLNRALGLPQQSVPEELKTPVNKSAVPESNILAGVAWQIADTLRGWRYHKLVEWAKQIGVKDAIMKSESGERSQMTESERLWLHEQLKDDLKQIPDVLSSIEER